MRFTIYFLAVLFFLSSFAVPLTIPPRHEIGALVSVQPEDTGEKKGHVGLLNLCLPSVSPNILYDTHWHFQLADGEGCHF